MIKYKVMATKWNTFCAETKAPIAKGTEGVYVPASGGASKGEFFSMDSSTAKWLTTQTPTTVTKTAPALTVTRTAPATPVQPVTRAIPATPVLTVTRATPPAHPIAAILAMKAASSVPSVTEDHPPVLPPALPPSPNPIQTETHYKNGTRVVTLVYRS